MLSFGTYIFEVGLIVGRFPQILAPNLAFAVGMVLWAFLLGLCGAEYVHHEAGSSALVLIMSVVGL